MDSEDTVKKEYTLHYILKSSMNSEEAHQYRATINERIQGSGGEIKASICSEAAHRLAYSLGRESNGYFCESVFLLEPEHIGALADAVKHDTQITRYMIQRKQKRVRHKAKRLTKRMAQEKEVAPRQFIQTPQIGEKRESVNMEEIDRKLDEIIKNI